MRDTRGIVACGMCAQPFAVPAGLLEGAVAIAVPGHPMLGPLGEPGRGDCQGAGLPPMVFHGQTRWEGWWHRFYGDAPLPEVGDGSDVWVR